MEVDSSSQNGRSQGADSVRDDIEVLQTPPRLDSYESQFYTAKLGQNGRASVILICSGRRARPWAELQLSWRPLFLCEPYVAATIPLRV